MKEYITPEMEIIEFEIEDIIMTSDLFSAENGMHTKPTTPGSADNDPIYDDPFGSTW